MQGQIKMIPVVEFYSGKTVCFQVDDEWKISRLFEQVTNGVWTTTGEQIFHADKYWELVVETNEQTLALKKSQWKNVLVREYYNKGEMVEVEVFDRIEPGASCDQRAKVVYGRRFYDEWQVKQIAFAAFFSGKMSKGVTSQKEAKKAFNAFWNASRTVKEQRAVAQKAEEVE